MANLYVVYLIDKETNEQRYVSCHKRKKDAEKMGNKELNARSPKKFDLLIRPPGA